MSQPTPIKKPLAAHLRLRKARGGYVVSYSVPYTGAIGQQHMGLALASEMPMSEVECVASTLDAVFRHIAEILEGT